MLTAKARRYAASNALLVQSETFPNAKEGRSLKVDEGERGADSEKWTVGTARSLSRITAEASGRTKREP
jgi:hypothetical protein